MLAPWQKSYDQSRQHIKKQRHYFANKCPSSQNYGFSSGHVWVWELDYKESWALKDWCFWTVVLEKTLEGPLNCKEIQPVHPKGNQSWIFTGRTDAEASASALWPPDVNWKRSWCWERLKAGGEGNDRRWDGWMASLTWWTWVWASSQSCWRQGSLVCCNPWGHRVGHDWATELTWTIKLLEKNISKTFSGINCSKMLLDQSPRANEIKAKIDKWDLIKVKSFCTAKETINKMKRQPEESNWQVTIKNTWIAHTTQCSCSCASCSVVSNSLQPHGLYCPWNSPGQNTGVGSLSPFQGIFPTQG